MRGRKEDFEMAAVWLVAQQVLAESRQFLLPERQLWQIGIQNSPL